MEQVANALVVVAKKVQSDSQPDDLKNNYGAVAQSLDWATFFCILTKNNQV